MGKSHAIAPMNTHPSYTLASRPRTGRFLRLWALLSRGTFFGAIVMTDVALIVAMSCFTGIAYHLAVYGDPGNFSAFVHVGVPAASIFAISNIFRGEYRLPNFFTFKPHARRTIQLWNVTLICLLMLGFLTQQITVDYSRGWIIIFYCTTLGGLILLRFVMVRITSLAREAGLISTKRIFLIGTGAKIGAFVNHYEPWMLGVTIVGCRFLTPVAPTASAEARRAMLDRDLAEAVASVRSIEPDAIFLLMPWSATETIDRCAETFLALPIEIHLGPEQILHKFEEVELSRLGPLASLQLTRMPLSRAEVIKKRIFDLILAAAALIVLTPLMALVALLIKIDSPGPTSSCNGASDSISNRSVSSSSAQCTRSMTARSSRRRRATIHASPGSDVGCGAGTSTKSRSFSTCSPATCRSSARGRTRCRTIANTNAASRNMRDATTSDPALRIGADPRLSRRNRHRRENAQPRRIRSVLHRQLVALARPENHHPHRALARRLSERLLIGGVGAGLNRIGVRGSRLCDVFL